MKQINFRIDENIYEILELISKQINESIPNISKRIILENIVDVRINIALEAYKQCKIGFKKAWKISGLSFFEFNNLLIKNNIESPISEDLDDKIIETALQINENDIFKKISRK